jgi:hypothetical protein
LSRRWAAAYCKPYCRGYSIERGVLLCSPTSNDRRRPLPFPHNTKMGAGFRRCLRPVDVG